MKTTKKDKMILRLETNNWNKQTKRDQDKALLFMFRVLVELSEGRKTGYGPEFYAQIP